MNGGDEGKRPERVFHPMMQFRVVRPVVDPSLPVGQRLEVTEADLGPWRDDAGLCHLRWPDMTAPERNYLGFQHFLEMMSTQPRLLGLTPTGTWTLDDFQSQPLRASCWLGFTAAVPVLPNSRRWNLLCHQAGGYSCANIAMIATRLAPNPVDQAAFDRLVRHLDYAEKGWFADAEHSPSSCEFLRESLASIGFSSISKPSPCEGFYPLEASQASLKRLDQEPSDLFPLLENSNVRPVVLLLCQNSD